MLARSSLLPHPGGLRIQPALCSAQADIAHAISRLISTNQSETITTPDSNLPKEPKQPQAGPSAKSATTAESIRTSFANQVKKTNELLQALRALEPLSPSLQPSAAKVLSLHIQSFIHTYGRTLALATCLGTTYTLWGTFADLATLMGAPESSTSSYMALAGAAGSTGAVVAYLRSRYFLDPGAAYRTALLQLNTSPAILEVMGAPLAGVGPRVSVVSAGGLSWSSGWPRPRNARVLLVFPLKGSERKGLALVEAKRLQGKILLKALAVDVPSTGGGEERIHIVTDDKEATRNLVFNELRQPLMKVLALKDVYADEDALDLSLRRAEAEQARLLAERLRAERKAAADASAAEHRNAGRSRPEPATGPSEERQGAQAAVAAEHGAAGTKAESFGARLQGWWQALVGPTKAAEPAADAAASQTAPPQGEDGKEKGKAAAGKVDAGSSR